MRMGNDDDDEKDEEEDDDDDEEVWEEGESALVLISMTSFIH